jgi:hypothetical protein
MAITITEALAEIKTIGKRVEKKRDFVLSYLYRQEGLKDPLEKDGGSVEAIRREIQAINDLENRVVTLRRGIQHANDKTEVTIKDNVMTIADWLTWRRDVAPSVQTFQHTMRQRLAMVRETAKRGGSQVIGAMASVSTDAKPTDYVINIDEAELARKIESLEELLGVLDGQLSLKNATIMIEE